MKILCLSDLWPPFPGGAESYIRNCCRELKARGHAIYVLTGYAHSKFQNTDYDQAWIQDIGVGDRHQEGVDLIWKFVQFIQPQLILTHHFFAGEFAAELPSWGPIIEVVHNRQRHPAARVAVFNSAYTAHRCGYQDRDIVILPPPSPGIVAADHSGRIAIGQVKALPNRVWEGRLYGKGVDLTYRLARICVDRRFLVLRGEWQGGEVTVQTPNVEYLEPVADINEFYSRCRVVLMPSGSEDAGTVPQECAVAGIPCVSSDVDGLPETNGGGIRLPLDDIQPWLQTLEYLDDPEYYRSVVQRQREYVQQIDWPGQFDELSRRIECVRA